MLDRVTGAEARLQNHLAEIEAYASRNVSLTAVYPRLNTISYSKEEKLNVVVLLTADISL